MKITFTVIILTIIFAIGLLMMANFVSSFHCTPNIPGVLNDHDYVCKRVTSLIKLPWLKL